MTLAEVPRGYLLALLCLPNRGSVLAQVSVSSSPLQRADFRRLRRPYPHVMLYADMGGMGRARRGLSWLKRELADRWAAQDGWTAVPEVEGRAFRRLVLSAVDRYSSFEAKNSIHHIDLSAFSEQSAARNYRRQKRSSPLAKPHTESAEV